MNKTSYFSYVQILPHMGEDLDKFDNFFISYLRRYYVLYVKKSH